MRVLFSASDPERRPGTGISGEPRCGEERTRGAGHTFGLPGRGSRGTVEAGPPVWGGAQEGGRENSEAERVCASDSATQPR